MRHIKFSWQYKEHDIGKVVYKRLITTTAWRNTNIVSSDSIGFLLGNTTVLSLAERN